MELLEILKAGAISWNRAICAWRLVREGAFNRSAAPRYSRYSRYSLYSDGLDLPVVGCGGSSGWRMSTARAHVHRRGIMCAVRRRQNSARHPRGDVCVRYRRVAHVSANTRTSRPDERSSVARNSMPPRSGPLACTHAAAGTIITVLHVLHRHMSPKRDSAVHEHRHGLVEEVVDHRQR